MELVKKEGIYKLQVLKEGTNKYTYREIDYITTVKGWEQIVDQIINYNAGKLCTSSTSWLSRFNSVLKSTIKDSSLKSFPKKSSEWRLLLKNTYLNTLCTSALRSSIETRVSIWNKNLYPFFEFLQDRDIIPVDVIIPKMKEADQVYKHSSFNIKIIGEEEPSKVSHKESLERLIVPVSLSRTDAQYLDELYYDIERKRNKVHDCLTSYWKNIRDLFFLGRELLENADVTSINNRIKNKDFYVYVNHSHKKHFANLGTRESLGSLLYCFKQNFGQAKFLKGDGSIPPQTSIFNNSKFYREIMNQGYLEVEHISLIKNFNRMLGLLDNRDISFITALLMMENPKFTVHALFDSKVEDKDGKQTLTIGDYHISFTTNKQRAKSSKKENLSDLSLNIISVLMEMRKDNLGNIPKDISKRLFIVRSSSLNFSVPTPQSTTRYISGADHNNVRQEWLGSYFPSLEKAGVTRNTINHKKIRATEGVLEFFRTGSVKSVSRKLGNSNRVVLQHYLPKPLIAAYNTRQVRRFQNLIVVAACSNEDYVLEAVDFNSLSELQNFIHDMLNLDLNGSNPLLNLLRENIDNQKNLRNGDLIANISEKSLTYLYAYNLTAEQYNLSADYLSQKDIITGLSPISFISLSKYLKNILSNHTESYIRNINKSAYRNALDISKALNWNDLLLKKERLS